KAEISAYKAGTATITAHAEDGSNVVGKCTVTVTENVPEATATPTPEPDYYRITFVKNDGSGSVFSLVFKPGTNYSTSRNTETRDGYEFAGWYTEATGGELVTSFILQKDITLYAHWTKNETGIKGSNLYLEGSETYSCYIAPEDVDSNINISQIEWVVQGNSDIVSISGKGYDSRTGCTDIGLQALRKGQVIILAKYNGQILRRWTINVTSDWSNYVGYVNWRKNVESQIWNSNMSVVQKLNAAKNYIKSHFAYKLGSNAAVYAYTENVADCITASEFMGDFAKDINCTVRYYNVNTRKQYEYIVDAYSASDGHIFCHILLNDQWVIYDASNLS
ncbi:MAG: InlB B-repeat-containing protein, partial [Blautia obeum]|nr:InlB B-repeat-containing protein [Blautia obeum]